VLAEGRSFRRITYCRPHAEEHKGRSRLASTRIPVRAHLVYCKKRQITRKGDEMGAPWAMAAAFDGSTLVDRRRSYSALLAALQTWNRGVGPCLKS